MPEPAKPLPSCRRSTHTRTGSNCSVSRDSNAIEQPGRKVFPLRKKRHPQDAVLTPPSIVAQEPAFLNQAEYFYLQLTIMQHIL